MLLVLYIRVGLVILCFHGCSESELFEHVHWRWVKILRLVLTTNEKWFLLWLACKWWRLCDHELCRGRSHMVTLFRYENFCWSFWVRIGLSFSNHFYYTQSLHFFLGCTLRVGFVLPVQSSFTLAPEARREHNWSLTSLSHITQFLPYFRGSFVMPPHFIGILLLSYKPFPSLTAFVSIFSVRTQPLRHPPTMGFLHDDTGDWNWSCHGIFISSMTNGTKLQYPELDI